MHTLIRLAAVVLLGGAALAGAAEPLVKPVAPPGNAVRIRLPMVGKTASCVFKAQIPKPKGKPGEVNEITLHVGTHSGVSSTIQQWKAWGFEVPADRNAELPELIIPGILVTPKPAKGRDIEFKLTKIKVSLYEAPGGEKGGISNALSLPLSALTGGADRVFEPRVHFADRLIELSAPATAVKKLGTGAEKLADLELTDDPKLLPAFIALNTTAVPFASVNGKTQYTRPTGKTETVTAGLHIGGGSAIIMSVSMARGCGVEMDREVNPSEGKVKELRLGPITGPGVKGQKDFVLKDVTVVISGSEDSSHIWLSSAFAETYFKDGVYGCEPSGAWKLHGRVKPDLLDDQKNRKMP